MTRSLTDEVHLPTGARFLVTGAAGFIGSALVEALVGGGFYVRGLDNLSTGRQANLDELAALPDRGGRFEFVPGDIRDLDACRKAVAGVDYVLHQAALGSVPRSIEDPLTTNAANIDGTLNMLVAARDAGTVRFVYAASSSVYGDHPGLPKVEDRVGAPLSPYAVTKYVNELYARVFEGAYGISTIGLRYFNVFGRRQDPDSTYAAVIPRFVSALLRHEAPTIHGDGEQSRDFTYIDNVVRANLLAATAPAEASGTTYNVACGERTTLNALYGMIRDLLGRHDPAVREIEPLHGPPRPGDVRHSLADITKIQGALGYRVREDTARGLELAIEWYRTHL